MDYRIDLSPEAQRDFRQLPAHVKAQALQLLRLIGQTPRSSRAKELRDRPGLFRIWLAGRWRIVYSIDDDERIISVIRVRLKDQIDYNSI